MHHPWFADMKTRMKIRPYKPKQTASFRLRKLETSDDAEPEVRSLSQKSLKKAESAQSLTGSSGAVVSPASEKPAACKAGESDGSAKAAEHVPVQTAAVSPNAAVEASVPEANEASVSESKEASISESKEVSISESKEASISESKEASISEAREPSTTETKGSSILPNKEASVSPSMTPSMTPSPTVTPSESPVMTASSDAFSKPTTGLSTDTF